MYSAVGAFMLILVGIIVSFVILILKVFLKYLKSNGIREEKEILKKSLGEVLRTYRMQCKMTQEFVAGTIGVSRQAVSKWEQGVSQTKEY